MLNLRLALLGSAVVVAAVFAGASTAARGKLGRALGADLVWWGLTAFTVGARAAWLLMNQGAAGSPLDALRITQGLYTPAGVATAVAAAVLIARKRRVGWRVVAAPATAAGLAGAAGWHATCFLQTRCGGDPVPWPVGWPVGGSSPQVPLGPLLALLAAALTWLVWRRPLERSARRALLCAAGYMAVLAGSGAVALRLAAWPSIGDIGFASVALALGVLALAVGSDAPASRINDVSAETDAGVDLRHDLDVRHDTRELRRDAR